MKTILSLSKPIKDRVVKEALLLSKLVKEKVTKKTPESIVSINLGKYYIKGIVVKDNQIVDCFIEKNNGLAKTLKKIWTDRKIFAKKVKVSIKDPSCLVRYFSFPKTDKKKINQALYYELSKFIPFPAEEVYFDYFTLKELNSRESAMLIAVAKKGLIENILNTFKEADIKISEISLDSICLINLLLANCKEIAETDFCLLDIGYDFSTMTILNKGVPFLTRDVKVGIKDIFQVISRIKSLDMPGVEKWVMDSKNKDEFLKLAQENFSALCKEMKSSFDYFEVNKGGHIEKLYISGGLVSAEGVSDIFSEHLETQTVVLKATLEKYKNSEDIFSDKKLTFFRDSFAVSFGLLV